MSRVIFEPCGRERHHYPHLTCLRPPKETPFDPEEGVIVDLPTFLPVVCPGSGSDAMDISAVLTGNA